ncbi:membrane protein [White-tailed deer poxvirus]|uniref:Membrane protein n=1 Tax=Deerpox virus (strain Mule deer/United States/W-848-83/1983) TaxID=305674 RepID=Q08FS9_DPV83|nr:Membrane protein [Deerpox virus W-848-83]ABI99228.1 membrane protein [Deerpox virus W-848-83]AUI80634.1 membrane protein [White-tailed deer poxvirus]
MEKKHSNIYFTPVFVEPTIKHSLLNAYKYTYIVLFEVLFVAFLLYLFFRSEIMMLLNYKNDMVKDPLEKFLKTSLSCNGDKLIINKLPNSSSNVNALAINRTPITNKNCKALLQSINGSQQVSLNDILRR